MAQKSSKAHKIAIILRFVTLGLSLIVGSGWLYLRASSIEVDKSPLPQSAAASGPAEVTLTNALPGSAALDRPNRPVDQDELAAAIRDASGYLVRVCQEDGSFVYRENLNPEHAPSQRYNMLRHAGTIYSMTESYQFLNDDSGRDAAVRAARYLKSVAIAPLPSDPELLAVWSRPELTGISATVKAKLGGAGLALVALTCTNRIAPNETPLEELRRLGEFILFMQKPDGGFYSRYVPSTGGRDDTWTSLYYPGEAALGLVLLYQQDPDQRWLQAAAKAIGYLARLRADQELVEADHWALIATQAILQCETGIELPVERELMIQHAAQVCRSILAQKPQFARDHLFHGGFAADGRTCPTATRLEGLIAAQQFLPDDYASLKQQMAAAIEDGLAFLLRAQIVSGEYVGGLPRSVSTLPAGHKYASTTFNRRATELRIDYVQHAMCAMIEYLEMKEAPSRDQREILGLHSHVN